MEDAKKVLTVALELPEHERAEIAARLLESRDDDDREGVDGAWAREIECRCAATVAKRLPPIGVSFAPGWNGMYLAGEHKSAV